MKKFISITALGLLAFAAQAQTQVDASLALQFPDLNAAPSNKISVGDQKSKKAPNLDTTVKLTQSWKIDDAQTVKAGASVDLYTPFTSGNADPYKSQWAAKVLEPFAQYQGFGVDAVTSLAIITFGPVDTASGTAAVGFYPTQFSGTKSAKDNAFSAQNAFKATYKWSADKTLAVVGGVETSTALVPVFFLLEAKPQVSVLAGAFQLDTKYNLTFKTTDADKSDKTTLQQFVEPKLTVDLGALEAGLKGLKLYTGGKLILADNKAGAKLTGSRWDDGLAYSWTVKNVGTFGIDTYGRVGGIGPDNTSSDTQYDLNLKVSYSLKF